MARWPHHSLLRRGPRPRLVGPGAAVLAATLLLTGCFAPSGPPALDNSTAIRWIAGDSIAYRVAEQFPTAHNAAQGGNGFIVANVGTIEEFTVTALGAHRPDWIVVVGGVNDWYKPVAAVIAAMAHFEDTMTGLGIKTLWATEPIYPRAFDPLLFTSTGAFRDWVLTRPFHADCGPAVVPLGTPDGVHPTTAGAQAYAQCLEANWPAAEPAATTVPETTTTGGP